MSGLEAMIAMDLGQTSIMRQQFDKTINKENQRSELYHLQEIYDAAHARETTTRRRAGQKYNGRVLKRSFKQGDLV